MSDLKVRGSKLVVDPELTRFNALWQLWTRQLGCTLHFDPITAYRKMADAVFLQFFNQRHPGDCGKREYLSRYHRCQTRVSERMDHVNRGGAGSYESWVQRLTLLSVFLLEFQAANLKL